MGEEVEPTGRSTLSARYSNSDVEPSVNLAMWSCTRSVPVPPIN